jgi:hypothetical protein
VPIIGAAADRFGIETTLTWLAFVPLLGAALAYMLPEGGEAELPPTVPVELNE